MITLHYDSFKLILFDLLGSDCRTAYKSYAAAFNDNKAASIYGTALCTLAGHGSTHEFGTPIFKIEFHSPEMKTFFLLRFGQYLK